MDLNEISLPYKFGFPLSPSKLSSRSQRRNYKNKTKEIKSTKKTREKTSRTNKKKSFCWLFFTKRLLLPFLLLHESSFLGLQMGINPVHQGGKGLLGLLAMLAGLAGLRACWPAGLLPCLLFLSLILFLSSTSLLLLPLSFFFFFSIPREASKQFSFYFIQDSHVSSLKLFGASIWCNGLKERIIWALWALVARGPLISFLFILFSP